MTETPLSIIGYMIGISARAAAANLFGARRRREALHRASFAPRVTMRLHNVSAEAGTSRTPNAMPVTKTGFTCMVADRYVARADVSYAIAMEMATEQVSEYLKSSKIEYGDPGHEWGRAGANELADSDLECWEAG